MRKSKINEEIEMINTCVETLTKSFPIEKNGSYQHIIYLMLMKSIEKLKKEQIHKYFIKGNVVKELQIAFENALGEKFQYCAYNHAFQFYTKKSLNEIISLIQSVTRTPINVKETHTYDRNYKNTIMIEVSEVSPKKSWILVRSDGYEIVSKEYETSKDAYRAMEQEFNKMNQNDPSSTEQEMSYIMRDKALLYDRGLDVYTWKII